MKAAYLILLLTLLNRSALAAAGQSGETFNRLRMVDAALDQYKLENQQRLPSEAEGLQAVQSYLYDKVALEDAWGHPFVYRLSTTNDGRVIYSVGKDGVSATGGNDPDDINLWDTEQKWQTQYQSSVVQPNLLVTGLALSLGILILVAARRRWKLTQKAG